MKDSTREILYHLIYRYESLTQCMDDIEGAFELMILRLTAGGKILICGNGGSAADAQHIAGELMKDFLKKRPLPDDIQRKIGNYGDQKGGYIASRLQSAIPALALTGQDAFFTAVINDIDAELVFAQQVYAFGNKNDILIGISTSGSSANVINSLYVAKAVGMATIGLTGETGGKMADLCDVTIKVPAKATPEVQELHMPVYHTLCAMLEEELF